MKYKIEKLDDSSVVYMRMIGTYKSDENFEMMKTFKHWIHTNHYWKYVEKYGVLGIALDNPLHVQSNQCRYDVVLRIDETVNEQTISKRNFIGGIYAVFKISHTKRNIENFFSHLENILNETHLRMRNEPIIERYIEEEGTDKVCEMLVPIYEVN
ncbi:GyrI-like domain-containing protein [Staphylococcus epidermidis]|uniref:GyrI-like domain-containing protein n=1 Tax=Staphylococcus epidermidis TaxID=1282 RepID=UPI0005FACCB7|nr:GyrI-like domain-containing protein [Staphylococcus epidermidis]